MKKKIIAAITALCLGATMFAGCGASEEETQATTSQKEENATDLVKKSLKDFNTSIDLDREYEGIGFGETTGVLGAVTAKLKHTKIDTEQIS